MGQNYGIIIMNVLFIFKMLSVVDGIHYDKLMMKDLLQVEKVD